jgi:hypothetical protein
MSDYPWSEETENLARGYAEHIANQIRESIDRAGLQARAGNLAAAAEQLEAARKILVEWKDFERHDNDIWAFTSVIDCIRRESPETTVPKAYQRFLDAKPSAKWDEDLTRAQKAFWYGTPGAQAGGEIRMVSADGGGARQKKGCFVATAVYGSEMAPQVETLRQFRDRTLLAYPLGQRFVHWYYRVSPPWARWIEPRPLIRKMIRLLFLSPLLFAVRSVAGRGFHRD